MNEVVQSDCLDAFSSVTEPHPFPVSRLPDVFVQLRCEFEVLFNFVKDFFFVFPGKGDSLQCCEVFSSPQLLVGCNSAPECVIDDTVFYVSL